ncbi:MAG TPA: type II restriction endonuclease, partial [Terracidiphilus sp.]|nr:type II restriction endonuclease [Terracidiphilus sp.]
VSGVIGDYFYTLDKFFLSRTQSRRSRAGSAFEVVLEELFKRLQYPFQSQPAIDGNPDFVFPSVSLYQKNAQDAIVFTAKRTLRERWRQIVTEGAKGLGFFLATIDEKVSEGQVGEMKGERIYLVVPAKLKEGVRQYAAAENVITFEDFLEDHLDPKMTKWKRHGVIS